MRIGQLAQCVKCQPMTIRYYEKIGLMPGRERSGSNYRLYSTEDLERLRFIIHCRSQHLPLRDIQTLLDLKDRGESTEGEIKDIIERHLLRVRTQIASLTEVAERLEDLLADKGSPGHALHVGRNLLDILSAPCPECADYDKDRPGDGHLLLQGHHRKD